MMPHRAVVDRLDTEVTRAERGHELEHRGRRSAQVALVVVADAFEVKMTAMYGGSGVDRARRHR